MIYLASSSPRRRALLKEAKIRFAILRPTYRETDGRDRLPMQLTKRHAEAKARSSALKVRNGIVLSADTVVYFKKKILGKPKNRAHAFQMLGALSGHWHEVITAVALLKIRDGRIIKKIIFSEKSHVLLKKMDKSAIKRYFKKIHPLDKAGAYALQSKDVSIVERVRGSRSNVVGLPMEKLKMRLDVLG